MQLITANSLIVTLFKLCIVGKLYHRPPSGDYLLCQFLFSMMTGSHIGIARPDVCEGRIEKC